MRVDREVAGSLPGSSLTRLKSSIRLVGVSIISWLDIFLGVYTYCSRAVCIMTVMSMQCNTKYAV